MGKYAKIIEEKIEEWPLEVEEVAKNMAEAKEETAQSKDEEDQKEEPKEELKEEAPPMPVLERQTCQNDEICHVIDKKRKVGRPVKDDSIDFKEKVTCEKCQRTFSRKHLKRHEAICRGEPWKPEPPKPRLRETLKETVEQTVKQSISHLRPKTASPRKPTEKETREHIRNYLRGKVDMRKERILTLFK